MIGWRSFRFGLLAGWVLCGVLTACGGASSHDTATSATSHTAGVPPPGSVVNTNFAFALYPVAGATLLDEQSVKAMHAQGSAGMQMGEKWAGVVIVERLPNTSLDAYAGLLKRTWGDDAKNIESEERVKFVGQDAVRIVRTSMTPQQTSIRVFNTFFVRQGFGYQVVAWQYAGERASPDAFFAAFHLTGGKIGGPPGEELGDWLGPTYAVQGDVFLGLLSNTKVRPQGGWTFVSENERLHINADAELLMHHRATGAYVMLVPDDIEPKYQEAYLTGVRQMVSKEFGPSKGAGKPLPAFGGQLKTDFYSDSTIHVHEAVHCEESRCFRYRLWYPSGAVKTVGAWKASELPWLEKLDPQTRSELSDSLKLWPSWTAPNAAFRNGLFRDTQYGIEVQLPEGVWTVAAPRNQAIFDASDAVTGSQLRVVAEPGVEPKGYHEDVVKDLMGAFKPRPSRVAGWQLSVGSMEVMTGVRIPTTLATRVKGKTAHRLVIVGLGATKDRARSLIKNTTLFSPQAAPIVQTGASWTDHRLGVSLDLPAGRWTYKSAKHDATSSVHSWEADAMRVALAVVSGVGQSNDQRLEFLMGFVKGASQKVVAEYQGEIRFAGTVGFAYQSVNPAGQTFRTYAAFVGDRMVALIAPDSAIDQIAPSVVVHENLPPRK